MPPRRLPVGGFGQPRADSWAALRSYRARPPGRAGEGERREVFCAALEQAEQLFIAAEEIGYGSRPLLAFYGLSQAGRALAAAAHADQWILQGHGITANNLSDDLLRVSVQNSGKPGSSGSFVRLAQLLGSGTLTKPVPIVAIWDSIPELARRPLRADLDHERRPALAVIKLELQTPSGRSDYLEGNWRYQLRVTGLPPYLILAGTAADLAELLASYPMLAGGRPPPSDDEDEGHLHAPPLFLDAADGIGGPRVFGRGPARCLSRRVTRGYLFH